MSLPNILLSLLREPMSGTDLIRLFRGTINHFWNTDLSQIYRALESLEADGCLRSQSLPSPRGPARRVYRLTARGRRRLAEWIRGPVRIQPAKLEFLAQLFSVTADERPLEQAREMLESMRGEAVESLATLEAIDAGFQQQPDEPHAMPAFLFYPWLTLRFGLLRRRAVLDWIDECLRHLDRRSGSADEAAGPAALTELVRALQQADAETGPGQPAKKKTRAKGPS